MSRSTEAVEGGKAGLGAVRPNIDEIERPVSAEGASAVRKICPPPSPWPPSKTRRGSAAEAFCLIPSSRGGNSKSAGKDVISTPPAGIDSDQGAATVGCLRCNCHGEENEGEATETKRSKWDADLGGQPTSIP
jgi:hypothetical protein